MRTHRERGGQSGSPVEQGSAPGPGKSTLTEQPAGEGGSLFDGAIWEDVDPAEATGAARAPSEMGEAAGAGGAPLPGEVRAQFEASLGSDLSGVRVHDGSASAASTRAAGARAYAEGQDIHFGANQYDPASEQGRLLLAHEVAHTVQQAGTAGSRQHKGGVSSPTEPAEAEADRAAEAMVKGAPANVTRGTSAPRPMAKGSPRDELLAAIRASLAANAWADVALRLNGLSADDLRAQVGKLTAGQLAHVREAAVAAMPGWSARVTDAIDAADGKAKDTAAYYARYEAALAAAKAGKGSWTDVANLLNGMGDWDIADRLRRLDWFQLMDVKQVANARVAAAVDKADQQRVQRARKAFDDAVAASDWARVAQQLNGFDSAGIVRSLQALVASENGRNKLRYLRNEAVRLMPDHHQRVTQPLDQLLAEQPDDASPDEELPYIASVELADISDDGRPLKGTPLDNFGGNAKVEAFARQLATVYGQRKPAREHGKDPAEIAVSRFAALRVGFAATGKAMLGEFRPDSFAAFARAWMSETREHADATTTLALKGGWYKPKAPGINEATLEELAAGHSGTGGQKVHPIINKFVASLKGSGFGFNYLTYGDHGGKEWGPFCLDVFPSIGKDDRGLYPRAQAMKFISKVDEAVASNDGDWSSCYNDATFNAAANQRFGNRFTFVGQQGTGNWHGALKIHFHFYIVPKGEGPGSVRSAPAIDPTHE